MSPGPEYVALIQSADGVDHYPLDDRVESPFERRDSPLSNPEKRRSTSDSFLPTILYVSTFLVSALSLFFSVTNLTHFPSDTGFFYSKGSEDVRVIDVKSLRRPSLYMGLEKVPDVQLLEGGHHHEGEDEANEVYVPFPGGPQEVARISSRFPLFPSRPDGWVLLTEEDRVVMKYSRPPAGTSSCQLASYFPTRSALGTTKLLTIESEDPSSPPLIQIHLHHSPPLSSEFSKLTWNSRPKSPSTSLKSLVADFGVNGTTNEFTCSEDHELVVELGCVGKGCRVEYRVEGGEPLVGIQLIQIYR